MNSKINYSLYFITDSNYSKKGVVIDAINASDCGASVIQYREKNKSFDLMISEAKKIKEKINEKSLFIINDSVELTLKSNADGVHLGQDDAEIIEARKILGKKIIGITVHNLEEAIQAEKDGADYLGISPIFETSTKSDAGNACGIQMIKRIKEHVSIPLIAIGGINSKNIAEVINAGANGTAVISEIYKAKNFCEKINELKEIIKEAKKD